jgi:hypothetical protein
MTPRSGVGSEIIHTASLKILLEHIDGWTDSKSTCIAFVASDRGYLHIAQLEAINRREWSVRHHRRPWLPETSACDTFPGNHAHFDKAEPAADEELAGRLDV